MGIYATLLQINASTSEKIHAEPELFNDIKKVSTRRCELEKEWHKIHFLLTGSARATNHILSKALIGSKSQAGEIQLGEPNFLSPGEVKEVANVLRSISEEEIKSRYNPEAMLAAKVYHQLWDKVETEAIDKLVHVFKDLVEFYNEAAKRGNATALVIE
jgi:hypothetical protein